jgi:uracil-DNA glycosylase
MSTTLPSHRSLPIASLAQTGTASPARFTACPNGPAYSPDLAAALASAEGCQACRLAQSRVSVVPGEGDPDALVAFIGEGPGSSEDRTGRPFVGDAGDLLDRMIGAMSSELRTGALSRTHRAFILNIVKCRPPLNRTPERDEVEKCMPYLWQALRALPKVRLLVALGNTPLRALSNQPLARITKERGLWFDRCLPGDERRVLRVMPTFHPAYLLRSPNQKSLVWGDLRAVGRELDRLAEHS